MRVRCRHTCFHRGDFNSRDKENLMAVPRGSFRYALLLGTACIPAYAASPTLPTGGQFAAGSLTFAIARRAAVSSIAAIDYDEAFVEALRQRSTDARITARQGDACALPFPDRTFDRALSLLVLHFVSDAQKAVREIQRVVRPGGVAAAAVWDTYGGMPSQRMFWDTVAAIEPEARNRQAASLMRPTTQPGELVGLFGAAGFEQISEAQLTIRMDFTSFENYWDPLIHGQGTLAEFLSGLPTLTRERIQNSVHAAYLCNRPDGPRSFPSTAWAVRGVVPAG
jgi:SAM-dependent methyltransferase